MQVDIVYNLGKYPVDTESREEKCGSKWSLADVRAEETPHNRYNMRPFTPPHIYACPLPGVVSSACNNNVDCGRSYDVHAKKKNGDKFSYFNHLVSAACAKRGKEYSPICV